VKQLIRVYLVIFLITMAKGTINVVFPPFLEGRAYLVSQIGLLTSIFGVFQLAARIPSGVLYSPRRARFALVTGLMSLGLSALGFTAFEHTAILIAMIILNGFAFGAITTIALALCIDARPEDYSSGAMMGWYTSAIAAGYAVGQPVGGYLADSFGFAASFAGTAALSLLAILVIATLSRLGQMETQPTGETAFRSPAQWSLRYNLRQIPSGVLMGTLIVFFVNLMFRSLHTFFPIYALAVGVSLAQIGFLRSALSLAAALVRPFSGKLFQVLHHRNITHIAMVAAAGAVFLSPALTRSMTWLFLLFVFMGIGRGLLRVTSATFVAESSDQSTGNKVGVWSGVYNAGLDIGSIAGPAVGGFVASFVGIPAMLTAIPVLALGAYAFISILTRRQAQQAVRTIAEAD
jgi:DHA1 family multidrug resistance protein-like MFS transporter